MLNTFLSIVDRLITLRQLHMDRGNERFDAVIEPTFDEISVLHGDYINMFEKTKAALPSGNKISQRKYKKAIENAKRQLVELRVQYAPMRDKIRILIPALKEDRRCIEVSSNIYHDATPVSLNE